MLRPEKKKKKGAFLTVEEFPARSTKQDEDNT
jgi:hypothetical protein